MLVQTACPDDSAIQFAAKHDFLGFAKQELEERRKQAEAAEAEKKKAAAEAQAKAQAENCTRARRAKATFESGQRIARVNAKGEREFVEDAERQSELKRLEGVIASDCKPAQ